MENQWSEFDDFELACLCHDYGFVDEIDFAQLLPVKLADRSKVESMLTEYELQLAFGE